MSFKLDWLSYIVSIPATTSKNVIDSICFVVSSDVVLYLLFYLNLHGILLSFLDWCS